VGEDRGDGPDTPARNVINTEMAPENGQIFVDKRSDNCGGKE
jgi:hypothetical protein